MKTCHSYPFPSVLPRFIAPMNATAVRELPEGSVWTYEANLDGYRCLASSRDGEINLWSCRGRSYNSRFPEVLRACERLPKDTVIDGEVIVLDAGGKISPKPLQERGPTPTLEYYVFDILMLRGRSLLGTRLETRRNQLREILYKVNYPVILTQSFNVHPAYLIRAAKELNIEGLIAKHKGSVYEPGSRSRAWLKYKLAASSALGNGN